MSDHALRSGLPILVLAFVVLAWDLIVRAFAIPPSYCRVRAWCSPH